MPTLYNPARAGETDFLRIRGAGRLQWIGVDNAPKTFAGAADIPLSIFDRRFGAGITFSQESIGLFNTLLASAQFSHRLKLRRGFLSIGLQAGYYNSRFRGSEVYIPGTDDGSQQPDDPAIPKQDLTGSALDLSVGAAYILPSFYTGISLAHLTSPKATMTVEGSESTESAEYVTELRSTLYFETGGNIALKNTLFELQPSLLAMTDFDDFHAVVGLRAIYNRFLSAGLGYRWKDAVTVSVGATFKNFFIGYAFDYPTSSISKASSGSHEIVAGYQLKLDLGGKNKHKHRSIRIM